MQGYDNRLYMMTALKVAIIAFAMSCDSPQSHSTPPKKSTQCSNTFSSKSFTEEQIAQSEMTGFLPQREEVLPVLLSETGLYSDTPSHQIHSALLHYEPKYQLWSDGEDKDRWIYIPECEIIDSSDSDNWSFPVGTRFFKEFRRNGQKIETRLIERIGPYPRDFAYASYLWNQDETEAVRVSEEGLKNANGTGHNIPSKQECLQCHGTYSYGGGRPSRGLGFSALQLNHTNSSTTLQNLVDMGFLSHEMDLEIAFPGDIIAQDALGYLHANCGNCHNNSADGLPHNGLNLWVDSDNKTVEETGAWITAVNQPTSGFKDQHVTDIIDTANIDKSALLYRMHQRGNIAQMPPIATTEPDEQGIEQVKVWIEGLP